MKQMLFILLLTPMFLFGQNDSKPVIYEVVAMEVNLGQEKAFEEAVKKHNMEYHKEGTPHEASLVYNINGPNGGKYSWIMGPTSFTDFDNRPDDDMHEKSWKNVLQYVKDVSIPYYWEYDKEMSFRGTDVARGKSLVRVYDLKQGKYRKFKSLINQVIKVYESEKKDKSYSFYWNVFADTKAGRDAVVVFPFGKWSWLDSPIKFKKEYEAVHGPGSYELFRNEVSDCVNGATEFIREAVK